ncbi:acyl-homoserine-lactone synthase [Pantoea sp. Morm]|jgi:acyl homoserine lactone synthase|uniref:acyl-homoserine-lactone synthase n=1 Tax=Pantoea sp. Morm TaxID=2601250 RepID=UPI0031FC900B
MLELFDVSYEELRTTRASELYRLRKQTFSDRLGWDVVCSQGMESLRWTDIKAMPAGRQ